MYSVVVYELSQREKDGAPITDGRRHSFMIVDDKGTTVFSPVKRLRTHQVALQNGLKFLPELVGYSDWVKHWAWPEYKCSEKAKRQHHSDLELEITRRVAEHLEHGQHALVPQELPDASLRRECVTKAKVMLRRVQDADTRDAALRRCDQLLSALEG